MKESKMEIKIPMFLLFMAVLFGAVLITSKCYKTGAYEGEKQHSMDEAEKHLHFGNAGTLKRKRVNRKRYRKTSAISGFESPTYLQFTLDDHPADWDRNKDQGF